MIVNYTSCFCTLSFEKKSFHEIDPHTIFLNAFALFFIEGLNFEYNERAELN